MGIYNEWKKDLLTEGNLDTLQNIVQQLNSIKISMEAVSGELSRNAKTPNGQQLAKQVEQATRNFSAISVAANQMFQQAQQMQSPMQQNPQGQRYPNGMPIPQQGQPSPRPANFHAPTTGPRAIG